MSTLSLTLEPLTRAAFAPFGEVIDTEGHEHQFPINNGSTQRFHDMAQVDVTEGGGRTLINVFRAQPLSYPLKVVMLERHPLGSQAFIPRSEDDFLLIVAPPAEVPEVSEMRAFTAQAGQGVNYAKGVWHHPILALKADQEFLVIDRGGVGHNCDEYYFDASQTPVLSYPPLGVG